MRGIEGMEAAHFGNCGSSRKLVDAAHEFEAQMMNELLKPLAAGMNEDCDQDASSGSGTVLTDFASEALGRSLSSQGGFGIAHEILKSFSQGRNGVESGKMAEKLQQNVLINSPEGLE